MPQMNTSYIKTIMCHILFTNLHFPFYKIKQLFILKRNTFGVKIERKESICPKEQVMSTQPSLFKGVLGLID